MTGKVYCQKRWQASNHFSRPDQVVNDCRCRRVPLRYRLMCKVGLEVLHSLCGRIKVAELERREFLVYQVYHLLHSHAFAGIAHPHFTQVPIRVYVEIAPLYHADVCVPEPPIVIVPFVPNIRSWRVVPEHSSKSYETRGLPWL